MNYTGQRNYIIAVFVSLMIHYFLLMISWPRIPKPKKTAVEILPVSLVEISTPQKIRRLSVRLNSPENWQKAEEVMASDTAINKLENQNVSTDNPKIESEVKPAQPLKDAAVLPKAEVVAVSDNPVKKPQNLSVFKENPIMKSEVKPAQLLKDAAVLPKAEVVAVSDTPVKKPGNQSAFNEHGKEIPGSGISDTGKQQSFGTGETMVKVVGPMPTYPPVVLKEGKEGKVTVRILVNARGKLELVIVMKSSEDLRLDYAATSSIERKWKFMPINEGYYIDLVFSFDIDNGVTVKFLNSKTRS
jgi:TonB family protein